MAGASVRVEVNDREVRELFKRLARRTADMTPVFAEIGEIVMESVSRNFEEQRSPKGKPWKPLSPVTRARKRHPGEILIESGTMFRSIHPRARKDHVAVGTNIVYAAVHQFGIGARSSLKSRRRMPAIPARPYLGVRDDDWPEIKDAISRWIKRAER